MSDKGKSKNRPARTKRQADALRENLHRRKLQARSRSAASAKSASGGAEEQSGPAPAKR